jgi:hypothetical protein
VLGASLLFSKYLLLKNKIFTCDWTYEDSHNKIY